MNPAFCRIPAEIPNDEVKPSTYSLRGSIRRVVDAVTLRRDAVR